LEISLTENKGFFMTIKKRIAFIGAGHITEMIVSRLAKMDHIDPLGLIASDPIRAKLKQLRNQYGISTAKNNLEAVNAADFVFINVMPNVVPEVVAEFKKAGFPRGKVIISVAGGIPISAYDELGGQLPVVRALPNPPSQVGAGIAALAFNPHVAREQQNDILVLFDCLGDHVVVREELVNAVMALSSPALTYYLFQSLIEAGIRAGIDRASATKIVSRTITGSMEVWRQREVSPAELLTEACTPGGISIESLFTIDKFAGKAALMEAIDSAIKKAEELSRLTDLGLK
jgi:pyrroline-5-carboxylate reductase